VCLPRLSSAYASSPNGSGYRNGVFFMMRFGRIGRRNPIIDGELALMESPYLTAKETIAYLRLGSESALYRLIREHRMPFCRKGRLYLFDTRDLDAWLRNTTAIQLTETRHRRRP